MQRLDKILSDASVASRRELKEIIRAGRVTVDGEPVTEPERKFDETACEVLFDGEPIVKLRPVLLMLNKPAGYVTSTDDPRDPTVMELIPEPYRKLGVKPAGRLDKETEGLLLFTNDGMLAHRFCSPRHGVWKTYYAEHGGEATEEDVRAFETGITLLQSGDECLPARLFPQGPGKSLIQVQEGKYHQVRRMMAARGMKVHYLRRIAEGELRLGELPLGELRELDIPAAVRLLGLDL